MLIQVSANPCALLLRSWLLAAGASNQPRLTAIHRVSALCPPHPSTAAIVAIVVAVANVVAAAASSIAAHSPGGATRFWVQRWEGTKQIFGPIGRLPTPSNDAALIVVSDGDSRESGFHD